VGEVVKKGPTSTLSVGDHIFSQMLFTLPKNGGLQEYTILNGEYSAVVPEGVADVEAALYPINAVTSAIALFTIAGLNWPFPGSPDAEKFDYKSQKVVIVGGGTNTGKLAVQFAKLAGVGTIIAIAGLSGAALLKEFGATHVISRKDSDIEQQVRAIVGDDLIYVYDTITMGNLSQSVSFLSNTKRGNMAYLLGGEIDEAISVLKAEGFESKRIAGFSNAIPEFGRTFWKVLPVWIKEKKIKPLNYHVIPGLDAEKVNYALDEYSAGRSGERFHVQL
jgi:NADPH2:quinone reductase